MGQNDSKIQFYNLTHLPCLDLLKLAVIFYHAFGIREGSNEGSKNAVKAKKKTLLTFVQYFTYNVVYLSQIK